MKDKILKTPLKYFLIIIATVLVIGIILACCFGFNTSIEFGGGTQLKVTINDINTASTIRKDSIAVLKDNKINVESSFVEDNGTATYLVIRSTNKTIKNADEVKQQLADKLNIDVSQISNFESIKGSLSSSNLILFGVGVILAITIFFFIGWLRYKLVGGATLALTILGNFLLYFALLAITRIYLSSASLVSLVVSSIICLVLVVSILENVRQNYGTKQFENLSEKDIVIESAKPAIIPMLITIAIVALFSIILLFVPNNFVQIFALRALIGLISSVLFGLFVAVSFHGTLLEIANLQQKQRVSKNPDFNKNKKSK